MAVRSQGRGKWATSGGPAMCWQPTAPTATASATTTTARSTSARTVELPGRRETPPGPPPCRDPPPVPVPYTVLFNIVPNPRQAGAFWVPMAPNQNQPRRFPLFHSADGGKTFSAVGSVDGANFAAFGKGTDEAPALPSY